MRLIFRSLCAVLFAVLQVLEAFADKPEDGRYLLNGEEVDSVPLRDLGWDDPRVLVDFGQTTILLDECGDYQFLSSSNDTDRIYMEESGASILVGLCVNDESDLSDLNGDDFASLKGVFIDGDLSEEQLSLIHQMNPEKVFVTLREGLYLERNGVWGRLTAINPGIHFLTLLPFGSSNLFRYDELLNFTELEFLSVDVGAEFFDLNLLQNCLNLKYLSARMEPLVNVDSLGTLAELRFLDISHCEEVQNIDFVRSLQELRELYLYSTWVQDLSPLGSLRHIEYVDARGSAVHKLPKVEMPSLKQIKLITSCVDEATAEEFIALNPQCDVSYDWNNALVKALQGIDRFRVRSGGSVIFKSDPLPETLYETTDSREIDALVKMLRIDPEQSHYYCGCYGSPTFEFYREGELVVMLSFHHGRSLRWGRGEWPADGVLDDDSRDLLLSWLDQRGVKGPKQEYEQDVQDQIRMKEERERISEALPASLVRFFEEESRRPLPADKVNEMRVALAEQYSDQTDQIRALLGLYGAVGGHWGVSYFEEEAAQRLLLLYSLAEVQSALLCGDLEENQLAGAVRYYGRDSSPSAVDALPLVLREQLLAYSLYNFSGPDRDRALGMFLGRGVSLPVNFNKRTGADHILTIDEEHQSLFIPEEIEGIPVTELSTFYGGIMQLSYKEHTLEFAVSQLPCEITKLIIPSSVTNIEASFFDSFDDLESVVVHSNNLNYSSMDGVLLEKEMTLLVRVPPRKKMPIHLPESVTTIGEYAFEGCNAITHYSVPNHVKRIASGAFFECQNMREILIPNSVVEIENTVFCGCSSLNCVVLPNSIGVIEPDTFRFCSSLTSIEIPEGVTNLGWCAFEESGLETVTLPSTLLSLDSSFYGCTNLQDILVRPENPNFCSRDGVLLSRDGTKLIQYPTGRKGEAVFPAGVSSLEIHAFWGCRGLTEVIIPDGVTNIGWRAFQMCSELESVFIPSSVTSIGHNAFSDCPSLTEIELPSGVDIEHEVFCSDSNLVHVALSDGLSRIGDFAFAECVNLREITIPKTVESIGELAFADCASLRAVYFQGAVPTFGENVFRDADVVTVYCLPDAEGWPESIDGRPVIRRAF
ncbi:MAG: leucine-rich repeat domain-containing protein [Lentisphaerae bacterium]|nr:leucine-rich repeat domain-containing protein [Lentisphaerota bacterium]